MQSATRTSKHPLGGISRDWRHRILRFHVPLALASALVFGLFMTLPSFDTSAYPALGMHSAGPFPQAVGELDMEDMDMDDGEDQAEPIDDDDHGGDEAERLRGDT